MVGGGFTYSKITMVSRTCHGIKWTHVAVRVTAPPKHPSTGHLCRSPLARKAMWCVRGSFPWTRLSKSISTLPLAHVVSSCALPSIQPPSPPRTPCTAPVPPATPGRKVPLPSSGGYAIFESFPDYRASRDTNQQFSFVVPQVRIFCYFGILNDGFDRPRERCQGYSLYVRLAFNLVEHQFSVL